MSAGAAHPAGPARPPLTAGPEPPPATAARTVTLPARPSTRTRRKTRTRDSVLRSPGQGSPRPMGCSPARMGTRLVARTPVRKASRDPVAPAGRACSLMAADSQARRVLRGRDRRPASRPVLAGPPVPVASVAVASVMAASVAARLRRFRRAIHRRPGTRPRAGTLDPAAMACRLSPARTAGRGSPASTTDRGNRARTAGRGSRTRSAPNGARRRCPVGTHRRTASRARPVFKRRWVILDRRASTDGWGSKGRAASRGRAAGHRATLRAGADLDPAGTRGTGTRARTGTARTSTAAATPP